MVAVAGGVKRVEGGIHPTTTTSVVGRQMIQSVQQTPSGETTTTAPVAGETAAVYRSSLSGDTGAVVRGVAGGQASKGDAVARAGLAVSSPISKFCLFSLALSHIDKTYYFKPILGKTHYI